MRVAWTVDAAAEFDQMLEFMAERNAAGARSVAARVARAVQAIETFPNAGTYNAETDTYQRFVPKTPVVLTYAIREEVFGLSPPGMPRETQKQSQCVRSDWAN